MRGLNIMLVCSVSASVALGAACQIGSSERAPKGATMAGSMLALFEDGEDAPAGDGGGESNEAERNEGQGDGGGESNRGGGDDGDGNGDGGNAGHGGNDDGDRGQGERREEDRPSSGGGGTTPPSGDSDDEPEPPPAPPKDPCEGVTCDWGQTCGGDGKCHAACAPHQATCKTSESPNASYTCCAKQCGPTGGCADTPPPSPSCPGGQVSCGHVCCPVLHMCVNALTGQCQVDF